MRPCRGMLWPCALLVLTAAGGSADAAWANVFQACCFNCQRPAVSSSSYYVAPAAPTACCAPACPQQTCNTRYVQRSYYQPVTAYQTMTYYEPVTSYRTSYYYEPVTSYRYTSYYDACSCSYHQVATPVTSYQVRSQNCPVQSFVARSCQVPVTSYQQSFYYEPVTTCSYAPPACPPVAAAVPAVSEGGSYAPPAVNEQRTPTPAVQENRGSYAPPAVNEQRTPTPAVQENRSPQAAPQYEKSYSPPPAQTPSPTGTSYRQTLPSYPVTPRPFAPAPPGVRLDKIVSVPHSQLDGQVVQSNQTPSTRVRLKFVPVSRAQGERSITPDQTGRFQVSLASGAWNVYLQGEDGATSFHSKLDLSERENRQVTLVSYR